MHIKTWLIATLLLISPSLYAHTGGHIDNSLMNGLIHPLTGIDHLLVLIAVGLISAKQGGKAMFVFPAFFMALMASGTLLSRYSIQIPFIESFIALSLIAFGFLITTNQNQQTKALFTGTSFFAVFHGYAHATEIPVDFNAASYLSALLLSSLAICLGSSVLGLISGKRVHYLFSFLCLSSGLYYLTAA
ncbi:MAG: HupE/UreJ family protein [Methylobacter sp.]|nr:HupE/UreJ family protein [Methylobacter sp.]